MAVHCIRRLAQVWSDTLLLQEVSQFNLTRAFSQGSQSGSRFIFSWTSPGLQPCIGLFGALLRDGALSDAGRGASLDLSPSLRGFLSTATSHSPYLNTLVQRQPLPSSLLPAAVRSPLLKYHQRSLQQGYASQGPRPPEASSAMSAALAAARRRQQLAEESVRKASASSSNMLMYLAAITIAMVGATYASVPLYRMFCQATGFGGTVQKKETVEEKIARHGELAALPQREITVHFNADVADGMPWTFTPTQREVKVVPGQSTLAFYTAHNTSDHAITGVSTYNVSPQKAGLYFNKIQCFCFEEQRLRPGEKIDMPVFFYIDPEFATDPRMDSINTLTLSYTFFKVTDEQS